MKKLMLVLTVIFSLIIAPLDSSAATKKVSRYDQGMYKSAKAKADLQVKLANQYATDAINSYNNYIKSKSNTTLIIAQKKYEFAMNSLENTVENTQKALELQHKYSIDTKTTFTKWQTAHYKKYDAALAQTMQAYQTSLRLYQMSKGIDSSDLQYASTMSNAIFNDMYGDVFKPLLTRAVKGWNERENSNDIHTVVDRILSPNFDHPVDVLAGYTTELATRIVFTEHLKGTNLQENKVIKAIPSAIGNTISITSIGDPKYKYETQARLLVVQFDLLVHIDEFYSDITDVFDTYTVQVKELKKQAANAKKAEDAAKEKAAEEQKNKCTTMDFTDPSYWLNCKK